MHTISKQFDFCYGHRVWSQTLNAEFSLDSCLKCRHLHGHQGLINISLKAEVLKDGMVTDFKHLNWFKKWLDDTLDHKFIMDIDDPLRNTLFPKLSSSIDGLELIGILDIGYGAYVPNDLKGLQEKCTPSEFEMYEGLVFVRFVPTSENLSKWIFEIAQEKMKQLGVEVVSVEFNETPKSKAIYS